MNSATGTEPTVHEPVQEPTETPSASPGDESLAASPGDESCTEAAPSRVWFQHPDWSYSFALPDTGWFQVDRRETRDPDHHHWPAKVEIWNVELGMIEVLNTPCDDEFDDWCRQEEEGNPWFEELETTGSERTTVDGHQSLRVEYRGQHGPTGDSVRALSWSIPWDGMVYCINVSGPADTFAQLRMDAEALMESFSFDRLDCDGPSLPLRDVTEVGAQDSVGLLPAAPVAVLLSGLYFGGLGALLGLAISVVGVLAADSISLFSTDAAAIILLSTIPIWLVAATWRWGYIGTATQGARDIQPFTRAERMLMYPHELICRCFLGIANATRDSIIGELQYGLFSLSSRLFLGWFGLVTRTFVRVIVPLFTGLVYLVYVLKTRRVDARKQAYGAILSVSGGVLVVLMLLLKVLA